MSKTSFLYNEIFEYKYEDKRIQHISTEHFFHDGIQRTIAKFENEKLVILKHIYDKTNQHIEKKVIWNNTYEKIQVIEETSLNEKQITKYSYGQNNLIETEKRYLLINGELIFSTGYKYDYQELTKTRNPTTVYKLVKNPVSQIINQLEYHNFEYDEEGQIKRSISRVHGKFDIGDYKDRKVVQEYNYTNEEGIVIIKTIDPSRKSIISEKKFRMINNRLFNLADTTEVEKPLYIKSEKKKQLNSFEFDKYENWIKHYRSGELFKSRNIKYMS